MGNLITILIFCIIAIIAHILIKRFLLACVVGAAISAFVLFQIASALEPTKSTVSLIIPFAFMWSFAISFPVGLVTKIGVRDYFEWKENKIKLSAKDEEQDNEVS